MGLGTKTALIATIAAFSGATLALWLNFGGSVYASYLTGVLMSCF